MTTVNTAYLLIRDPAQPVSVRCFAVPSGRSITNSQVTAEQTAAIIEREVGRLLQLALAAAQIPGVTPASGSVYAQSAPSAAANASAVRTELATELGRIDATVSSRLASAGYTAPDNAGVSAIKAKTDNLPATPANEATVASRLAAADYVAPDNAGIAALPTLAEIEASTVLAKSTDVADLPSAAETAGAVRSELATELARVDATVSSRLATAGYTAPDNAGVSSVVSKLPSAGAKIAGEGATAKNLDQVSVDISGLATSGDVAGVPAAVRAELETELDSVEVTRTLVSGL